MSAYLFSESDYKQEFWSGIEKEIGGKIPEIVKTVLSKCGYEIRFCLENLTITDIDGIENHAKTHLTDKLKRWLKSDSEYEKKNPSEFVFLPGHRKIIALLPKKLSASKVSEHALDSTSNGSELNASTIYRPNSSDKKNKEVPISIALEAELESELCKSIRGWMINKKFHESVSIANLLYNRIDIHLCS